MAFIPNEGLGVAPAVVAVAASAAKEGILKSLTSKIKSGVSGIVKGILGGGKRSFSDATYAGKYAWGYASAMTGGGAPGNYKVVGKDGARQAAYRDGGYAALDDIKRAKETAKRLADAGKPIEEVMNGIVAEFKSFMKSPDVPAYDTTSLDRIQKYVEQFLSENYDAMTMAELRRQQEVQAKIAAEQAEQERIARETATKIEQERIAKANADKAQADAIARVTQEALTRLLPTTNIVLPPVTPPSTITPPPVIPPAQPKPPEAKEGEIKAKEEILVGNPYEAYTEAALIAEQKALDEAIAYRQASGLSNTGYKDMTLVQLYKRKALVAAALAATYTKKYGMYALGLGGIIALAVLIRRK